MWFLKNPLKDAQEKAKHLILLGKKVYDYRRDLLSQSQCDELLRRIDALKEACSEGKVEGIKKAHQQLHLIATTCGGNIYPVTFLSENVEMLIVAAILAIGIRSFFIQPFKIPTNSMYPTYSGMIEKVYQPEEKMPSILSQAWRFVALGATTYQITSPAEGYVNIPLSMLGEEMARSGAFYCRKATGRKWLGLMPEMRREYVFYVGKKEAAIQVPWDFRLDDTIIKAFFPNAKSLDDIAKDNPIEYVNGHPCIVTSLKCKAGDPVLRFEILTGDMVFVDRISYNFVKPKVGDSFVFRTIHIPHLDDKYYIKRLVGLPGDTLEVKEPILYRNGAPITGAKAFELNSNKVGEYRGYTAKGHLSKGAKEVIPEKSYYAMGDNSPYSGDSRYFGYVPEKDVVGKALFILHPFSNRWGLAK